MISISQAFSCLPNSLKDELVAEYSYISKNYYESRWLATELSGGRFSEIAYSIIHGHINNQYPDTASKPANFVDACRKLEKETSLPRSFRILIPRLLPALYEVRNNRNIGHVGGDISPNAMDALFVLSSTSWIMAEFVRVLHNLAVKDAETLVTSLSTRKLPIIWESGEEKRFLNPNVELQSQILIFLDSANEEVDVLKLLKWLDYKNSSYLRKKLRMMHKQALVNFVENTDKVRIIPPGSQMASEIISKLI